MNSFVQLHKLEDCFTKMTNQTPSFVTFFKGQAPINYLQERMEAIIRANPWIAGWLMRKSGKLCICVPSEEKISCFRVLEVAVDNELDFCTMDYEKLVASVARYTVKRGQDIINNPNEPIFKVTIITVSNDRFALLTSLCHVAGDGNTMYELYGMLSCKSKVHSLFVERRIEYPIELASYIDGHDTEKYIQSIPVTIAVLITLLFGRKGHHQVFRINSSTIEKMKSIVDNRRVTDTEMVPFISTNDIITSWFFKITQCYLGVMAVNLRNRMKDLTSQHAGNYFANVGYQREDFTTPGLIRKSIINLRRYYGRPYPGGFATIFDRSLTAAAVTNWISFYREVDLEGCEELIHLPILNPNGIQIDAVMVPFKPNPKDVAIYVVSRSMNVIDLLHDPMIDGLLLSESKPTRPSDGSGRFRMMVVFGVGCVVLYWLNRWFQ